MSLRGASTVVIGATLAGCAHTGTPAPNERANHLAVALDELLNQDPSATAVLERWCASRYMADPARIVAEVDRTAHKAPSAETLARLRVEPGEPIGYRHVRLKCGAVVLSEADNWYVPDRLTPEMRAALEGDTPFGKVIRPLAPVRTNLDSAFRWPGQRPGELLRHHALLTGGDGQPLAEVVETYVEGIAEGED